MYHFISYTLFYVLEHTLLLKTIIDRSFRNCRQGQAFSDFALWRHRSWPVTSREREILVLWRHIHWLFLHAQIGAKAIFTNE